MKRAAILVLVLFSAACATVPKNIPPDPPRPRPFLGAHGFELSSIDRTVGACDDFYQYAVGGWRQTHPLPPIYSRYGRFEEVAERNRQTLRAILETAAKSTDPVPGSNAQKLGDFWTSCMNETAIEAAGVSPIRADLDRVDALSNRADVAAEIQRLHAKGVGPLFRFSAQNDFKNSKMIIGVVSQSGLGLPDRDYYLMDSDRFKTTRTQYVEHVAKMFELAGVDAAKAKADAARVLELETALARASMPRTETRNPENIYHITPVSELQSIAPSIEWPRYFESMGLSDLRSVNVAQPEFIREANRLLTELPLETWKAYLRWNVIDSAAPYLSSAFVNQNFAFRGQQLSGRSEEHTSELQSLAYLVC